MAYVQISLDSHKTEEKRVERLRRFNDPFEYGDGVSLDAYEAANEAVKVAADAKNAALLIADEKGLVYIAKLEKRDKLLISLRTSTLAEVTSPYSVKNPFKSSSSTLKLKFET